MTLADTVNRPAFNTAGHNWRLHLHLVVVMLIMVRSRRSCLVMDASLTEARMQGPLPSEKVYQPWTKYDPHGGKDQDPHKNKHDRRPGPLVDHQAECCPCRRSMLGVGQDHQ